MALMEHDPTTNAAATDVNPPVEAGEAAEAVEVRIDPLSDGGMYRQTVVLPESPDDTSAEPAGSAGASAPAATEGVLSGLVGLLAGYAILVIGNGLFQTLIPLRMLDEGFSTVAVGLVQSCYYGGFMLGAISNRRMIDRIGQYRAFVALAACVAILAMAFGLFRSAWIFAGLRLMTGVAFMGLYTSIESWLNGTVPNHLRGRVFGTYTTINYLSVGLGQFLLNVGGPAGNNQLFLAAALFVAAILPVTMLDGWPPTVPDDVLRKRLPQTWADSIRQILAHAPLGVPGCIASGMLYSTFYAMTPVFLTRIGLGVQEISAYMGIALIGALLPQWPIGRLSDIVDRRRLVFIVALVAMGFSALLIVVSFRPFVWIATLLYAAALFTQYGLIVSHVNDRTQPEHRVAVSACLILLFSLGGIAGPAVASLCMAAVGPHGLFLFDALACAALAFAARRTLTLPAPADHAPKTGDAP